MTRSELALIYRGRPSQNQATFLAHLAHELTIVARASYVQGPNGLEAPPAVLITLNELQHQVSGQLGHLLKGDEKRYPDDEFLDILFGIAEKQKLDADLLRCFETVTGY